MLKWSSSYRKKHGLIDPSNSVAGALDTTKIHIVPKHSIHESAMKKAPVKVLNLPFEATFRLQVSFRHWMHIASSSILDLKIHLWIAVHLLFLLAAAL